MLDEFIQHTLAQIDDLAELKVSLVAMRLLELKNSESASTTQRELGQLPALRQGLGFAPQIALESALKRAVMRGTLIYSAAPSLDEPRYFLNTPAGCRAVDAIELADQHRGDATPASTAHPTAETLSAISREIERLEMIEAYPASASDEALVEEWLARGYTRDEIARKVREVLAVPRPKGTPARTLQVCAQHVAEEPPAEPSAYYQSIVARSAPLADVAVAHRELTQRLPNGHAYYLLQAAVDMFGATATINMMRQLLSSRDDAIDDLIPMLSEREEAEMELARSYAVPDLWVRELIQLYETHFGLLPTSRIGQDIATLSVEIKDIAVWRAVFQYAAAQNKRNWEYVSKLLSNPSPALFEPLPVNDLARFAFTEYKRRISRGVLDQYVAGEINALAQQVTDQARWEAAFNKAATANALNWNYLKTVISNPQGISAGEGKDGRRKQGTTTRQKGVSRRPQIEDSTEVEREAARERARQRIAERAKRRATSGQQDDPSSNGVPEQS